MSARKVLAISLTVLLLLMALPTMLAQSGGSGGSGSNATKSAPTSTTTARPNSVPQIQQERRLVFVTGKVVIDDGTEPTERVAIERVCNGLARREAYADSHGQFGFQIGGQSQIFQDATVGSNYGFTRGSDFGGSTLSQSGTANPATQGVTQQELMGCELRASAPGFRSDNLSLAGRQLFDNPNVGTIVLHRLGKVEGTRVSATSLKAPKEAKKAFEKAEKDLTKGNKQEAAAELNKAIVAYPKYAEALALLGQIDAADGKSAEAKKLFEQAIDADKQFLEPYFGLAVLASKESDWQAASNYSERALALNAYEYPVAYYYHAAANYNLQKLDIAEKSARTARRLDSQHKIPRIDYLLANILVRKGDYPGAAEQLKSFLAYQSSGPDADAAREMLKEAEQRIATASPAPAQANK